VLQLAAPAGAQVTDSALRSYVSRHDASYGWTVRQRTRLGQSDCVELTLTSQTWKGIVWKHRLFLIVPDGVEGDADALLVIEGGRWKDSYAAPVTDGQPAYPKQAVLLAGLAQQMRAPLAVVLNVPQQPIFDGRTEDAIIAYTFDRYLETGEQDWPLLLPMVKSAVRAMDAVQAFAQQDRNLTIDRFTVTGASKRGWTTWLTSAVDDRVMALAPMVIDMLNMAEQLPHQHASWGAYSDRIHDYTDIDLPSRIDSPRGQDLLRIIDPYAYRHQVTQPKLLLLGTNDGFWTLDALNLYWDGLEGDKYVVYVPNADHDLAMDWQRVFGGIRALHRHAAGLEAMPPLTWRYEESDVGIRLTVDPGEAASRVLLWSADSPTRDFRKARWSSRPLTADAAGRYAGKVLPPAQGYTAVFAELTYLREVLPLSLSTTIRIVGPAEKDASRNE
jgi:PhoPQ-activated pathogenicity-related protein